jgi:hypothetical protein
VFLFFTRLSTRLGAAARAYSKRRNQAGFGPGKMAGADLGLVRTGHGHRAPDPSSVHSIRARERAAYDITNKIQLYFGEIGRHFKDSDDLLAFTRSKIDRNLQDRVEFARITSETNPSCVAYTSAMDKALYIIHKMNGEFDQEGRLLNV